MTLISRNEAAEIFGVNPQTITNWAKDGLIKRVSKTHFNRESVLKLKREFSDIPDVYDKIEKKRFELTELEYEYDNLLKQVDDIRHELSMLEVRGLTETLIKVFKDVVDEDSNTRNMEIFFKFLSGKSIKELSEEYNLTTARIGVIITKTQRIITYDEIKPYSELKKEIESLQYNLSIYESAFTRLENHFTDTKNEIAFNATDEYRQMTKLLSTPLRDFNLSIRCLNVCLSLYINTLGDLIRYSRASFSKCRNIGKKTMQELDLLLEEHNLYWDMNIDNFY